MRATPNASQVAVRPSSAHARNSSCMASCGATVIASQVAVRPSWGHARTPDAWQVAARPS